MDVPALIWVQPSLRDLIVADTAHPTFKRGAMIACPSGTCDRFTLLNPTTNRRAIFPREPEIGNSQAFTRAPIHLHKWHVTQHPLAAPLRNPPANARSFAQATSGRLLSILPASESRLAKALLRHRR